MENIYAIKGDFYYSKAPGEVSVFEDHFCVVKDGITEDLCQTLPDKYSGIKIIDYSGKMIIPGMVDLHLHAPQYSFRGLGMDMELLDWLNTYTFPEESKYLEWDYADNAYQIFSDDLSKSWTTRAVIFGTISSPTTILLMDKLEKTGLKCYVGKVNMDRNAPSYYVEDTISSYKDTLDFINATNNRYKNIKPVITPRFIPSCTDDLMYRLGELQKETGIPVQSHLSENPEEVRWVGELCPSSSSYADAYDRFGLFGSNGRAIMAHCVYSDEGETALIKKNGVFVAHCPGSNANLSSGIAPIRRFLDMGIRVGLGTDIAGGHSLSIAEEMVLSVQMSKMRWRYVKQDAPLGISHAFYMATKGGGEFFGKAGSFEKGYEFDALILDDGDIRTPLRLKGKERLERNLYLYNDLKLVGKYIKGSEIGTNRL